MQHRDRIILEKIISIIKEGESFMEGISKEEFLSDPVLQNAMCMIDIRIGELVKVVGSELRKEYPAIPWKSIACNRDIAAHKYDALDFEQVYITVTQNHPELKDSLNKILAEDGEDMLQFQRI